MFDGTGYFPVFASIIIIARYIALTSERAFGNPCAFPHTLCDHQNHSRQRADNRDYY